MLMFEYFRLARMFVAGTVLAMGVGWFTPLAGETVRAKADDQAAALDREIHELVASLSNKGFYGLKDPKATSAIEKLQKMSKRAAPAIAKMLADGHMNREKGWIQLYRPLVILKGMGEHAKVALPDVIKALDDQHGINVGIAVEVLGNISPGAKDAVPALLRLWENPPTSGEIVKKALASALQKIDPESAEKAGIK